MSKSKTAKKSLARKMEEAKDVTLAEFTKSLEMEDDFVWIENTPFEVVEGISCEDSLHGDTSLVNIVQLDTNIKSCGPDEEFLPEYTENLKALMSQGGEWDREVLVDQHYWERSGAVAPREHSSRVKYPASQRLTVTELNKIEMHKSVSRQPSYYKLNMPTTATLNALIDKKIVQSCYNVIGCGTSSVVIYACCVDMYNKYSSYGMAVKVYKLSSDVKKNNAVMKRVQRECEHLKTLFYCRVPSVHHKLKNVIIMNFLGEGQELYPSLSSLPSEYAAGVYEILVQEIQKWYNKYGIVHGKLCAKSVLYDTTVYPAWYYSEQIPCRPYIIGWGHSIKRDHPWALMKLMRDCHFVTTFFKSRDVLVKPTTELFKEITGLKTVSPKVQDAMNRRDLWQEGLLTNPNRK